MKSKTTKILSMVLTLCMLFSISVVAAPTVYQLTVADIQVTSENASDILEDGGSVMYNDTTKTLTLGGANINNCIYTIIRSDLPELTIRIFGTNVLSKTPSGEHTIVAEGGNLNFIGDGTLEVTTSGSDYDPIWASGVINFGKSDDEEAFTGTVTATVSADATGAAQAIYGGGGINIYSGVVNAVNNADREWFAFDSNNNPITVYGGKVVAKSNGNAYRPHSTTVQVDSKYIYRASDDAEYISSNRDSEATRRVGAYYEIIAGSHFHNDTDYTELTSSELETITSGNYYLNGDITAESNSSIPSGATVTLCLNGHTLDMGEYSVEVADGGELTICDCNETQGKITSVCSESYHGTLTVDGIATVTGGQIENTYTDGEYGRMAVFVWNTFILDGGKISNPYEWGIDSRGYTEIRSGEINAKYGVFNYCGGLYISGGTITADEVAVDVWGNTLLIGEPVISGGTCDINIEYSENLYASYDGAEYTGGELMVKYNGLLTTPRVLVCDVTENNEDLFVLMSDEYCLTRGTEENANDLITAPAPLHYHESTEFTRLPTSGSAVGSGNYYLGYDAIAGGDIEISSGATVTLCLNGHTLDMGEYNLRVADGGELTICDCNEAQGKITSVNSDYEKGTLTASGTVTVAGGEIENTYTDGSWGGTAVVNEGTFTLDGGKIISKYGYGIDTDYSSENTYIKSGEIDAYSCGIWNYCTNVYISGGTITADEVAIDAKGYTYLTGEPVISGGTYDITIEYDEQFFASYDEAEYTGGELTVFFYRDLSESPVLICDVTENNEDLFTLMNNGYYFKRGEEANANNLVTAQVPVTNVTVKDSSGTVLTSDITVTLNDFNAALNVDKFEALLSAGVYQLTASKAEGSTVTKTVEVTNTGDNSFEITLPDGKKSVELQIGADTPLVLVEGLNEIAIRDENGNEYTSGDEVDVKLTVQAVPLGSATSGHTEIINQAGQDKMELYDIKLEKTVNSIPDDDIGDTNTQVIEIKIPFNSEGKFNVTPYRNHNGTVTPFTLVSGEIANPQPTDDGKFAVSDRYVTIYTKHFSEYAIGYNDSDKTPAPTQPSGGGGSSRCTVKFKTNGGSEIKSVSVVRNNTVAEPTAPTKNGYIFDGWYTNQNFTKKYDFGSKVTKDIILYARWIEDKEEPEIGKDNENAGEKKWNPFTDVNENDWFYDVVREAYLSDLTDGTSGNTFSPYGNITRGMFVTILYRLEGEPESAKLNFKDVESSKYYAEAVAWANANSIVLGFSEEEYAPEKEITREQMASILFRYAQYKGMDAITLEENLGQFSDSDSITEYAVTAMNWAVGRGIMEGRDNGCLDPLGNATRAEAVAMLIRMNK